MDVYFQHISTKDTFALHFNEDSTVKSAKEELCRTRNIVLDNIKFIFQKKILLDTVCLSEIQTSEADPILFYVKRTMPTKSAQNDNNNNIEVISNKIKYRLNKPQKTAVIIAFIPNNQDAFIPRSIQYESQEYVITSIDKSISNYLNSIKFAPDSEISILEEGFLSHSNIKTASFHPVLKKISKQSFLYCRYLETIDFQPESQLQIIEEKAFQKSSIKHISFPASTIQIDKNAFELCSCLQKVEFPANSKLKKIGENAFYFSDIMFLSLPSSVSQLDDGWCSGINKLNNITIFQCEQQNITYFDEKFILQKSDPKSDVFDILLFARRDVKTVVIPPFIKKISSHAFEYCTSIESIEISENSELQEIGCYAFHCSSIESISFPPHLTMLGEGCFKSCFRFKTIKIPENSELKAIGKLAFDNTIIESISIPIHLHTIDDEAFNFCNKLKRVDIPENSELQTIGKNAFFFTSIESIAFSSHLTLIQECAFHICSNLKKIVLTPSSSLLTIEKDIFGSSTPIESISIPSSNIDIKEGWCSGLINLSNIEIIPNNRQDIIYYDDKFILGKSNNESDLYDVLEFARRDIESALIPSFIKVIKPFAFSCCKQLKKIEIQENSNLVMIGSFAFASSSIEKITIPKTVKKIGESAFSYCFELTQVENSIDSQLTEIENNAFESSQISEILISASVLSIGNSAFCNCQKLKKVEFTKDSNLTKIGKSCFRSTNVEQFSVPQNVVEINNDTFHLCKKLRIVDFHNNSKIQKIGDGAFSGCLIEKISIPSSVTYLGSYVFSNQLREIDFQADSKLQLFGYGAFAYTSIKSLHIPPLVKIIDTDLFVFRSQNLQIIEFAENSQLEKIIFSDLKDIIIMTPSFLMNSVKINYK